MNEKRNERRREKKERIRNRKTEEKIEREMSRKTKESIERELCNFLLCDFNELTDKQFEKLKKKARKIGIEIFRF